MLRVIGTITVLLVTGLSADAQDGAPLTQAARDLAECKMAAIRLGNWERDNWFASTATGQYLVACMTSKGYRRKTVNWGQAYNPMSEVVDKKKPLYRSEEAEFLVKSGCFDYGTDTVNIAIAECWSK